MYYTPVTIMKANMAFFSIPEKSPNEFNFSPSKLKPELPKRTMIKAKETKNSDSLKRNDCRACKTSNCKWYFHGDITGLLDRQRKLSKEILRVRMLPKQSTTETNIAASTMKGGNSLFHCDDLLHELTREVNHIERQVRLSKIDKELHDILASDKEYSEVTALHGYTMCMWTSEAEKALEYEHNKLVATTVSSEVVDTILDGMLDGWHFGEIQTKHTTNLVEDAIVSFQNKNTTIDMGKESPLQKMQLLNCEAKNRLSKENNARNNKNQDKKLDEAEKTIRYGIFCLTFMYFRTFSRVRNEKKSWLREVNVTSHLEDGNEDISEEGKKMKAEEKNANSRKRALDKAMSRAVFGKERLRIKNSAAKEKKVHNLREKKKKTYLEGGSSVTIQRLYRGHLGRKVAGRWRHKKAELDVVFHKMSGCAVEIQRTWRAHRGRVRTAALRAEVTAFILKLRAEEAALDEEQYMYWTNHPLARLKRDVRTITAPFVSK
mmetsp:Transcript_23616/g.36590  ORF Transcript_23616/g.36590 Transcript_23616/m.36590 type:complete len:490 (-) Transcript_23616:126-1595(-)